MNKKPLYNAILAAGYIAILVSVVGWVGNSYAVPEDNMFMPIAMLALLVLSVSVMAFLFFYEPVILILDGKRAEASRFFLTVVSVFALITIAFGTLDIFIIPKAILTLP